MKKKYSEMEIKMFNISMEERIAGCGGTYQGWTNAAAGCYEQPLNALGQTGCMKDDYGSEQTVSG